MAIRTSIPRRTTRPAQSRYELLRATAASAGCVTGRARIVHNLHDASALQATDILVCTSIAPAWTPLLALVAGVIAESGAVLSSAAIVAREYGTPAVVGVSDATTRIRDGQVVRIDGASGLVELEPSDVSRRIEH